MKKVKLVPMLIIRIDIKIIINYYERRAEYRHNQ